MKLFSLKFRELILTVDPKTFTIEMGAKIMRGLFGKFPNGLSLEFKNNEFDTRSLRFDAVTEAKLIRILRKHPSYGISFVTEDHTDDNENQETVQFHKDQKKTAVTVAAETDHDEIVNAAQVQAAKNNQ